MCLIITGKSSKVRSTLLDTHGLLSDIYTSNPDGIGFMYGTAKGLKVTKTHSEDEDQSRCEVDLRFQVRGLRAPRLRPASRDQGSGGRVMIISATGALIASSG